MRGARSPSLIKCHKWWLSDEKNGKTIGKFYDYFSIAFIYMSYIVMIAGSGATLNQQYGLPIWVGAVLMGLIAGITVIFGLGKIVDVIGKIGPAIIVLTIFLGIAAIGMNPSGLVTANDVISELDLMRASTNWFFSVIVFAGIFTTSVPLLWQVIARFSEEKTPRFRMLTVGLSLVGIFVGLNIPFDRLVNVIYVVNGYVGIILIVFMLIKTVNVRILKREADGN